MSESDYFKAIHELNAIKDRLPIARDFVYEHEGKMTGVRLNLGATWPEIVVQITPNASGLEVRGHFREDGSLKLIEIESSSGEVTAADLRNLSSVRTLKSWEVVGREMCRQILAGVEVPEFDATSPTAALRELSYQASRQDKPVGVAKGKRGAAVEQRLRQVVDAYREAVAAGDPRPRQTVALKFGYSGEHVGRLLSQARKPRDGRPPLLGPAAPGKAGETVAYPGIDDLAVSVDRTFARAEDAAAEIAERQRSQDEMEDSQDAE